MRKSEEISWERFNQLRINADILEQDEFGIKVLRLESGDIFKVFRVKSIISGARIYSYARRFCRNAERLQKLIVPTVSIKQLYHFENSTNTAVLYKPLPGKTLRELAYAGDLNESMSAELGKFIAKLHSDGVHFRSLHLGNIVLTPSDELGLIDISDMNIYQWGLGTNTRIRNFRHLWRYPKDMQILGEQNCSIMKRVYFEHCRLPASSIQKINRELQILTKL